VIAYVKQYPIPGNDEQRKGQTNPNQVMLWNLINVLENLWNTSFKLISPLVTIILIRRQRRLKYPLALKWIHHLLRLLDLVEPKLGKVKKNYSKFQGRITKPQLTWKQRADVVYFHLHWAHVWSVRNATIQTFVHQLLNVRKYTLKNFTGYTKLRTLLLMYICAAQQCHIPNWESIK